MICRSHTEARSFESCWNFLLYPALHFLLITLQNTSLTASKIAVPRLSNIVLVATEFWPRRSANKRIPNKLGTLNTWNFEVNYFGSYYTHQMCLSWCSPKIGDIWSKSGHVTDGFLSEAIPWGWCKLFWPTFYTYNLHTESQTKLWWCGFIYCGKLRGNTVTVVSESLLWENLAQNMKHQLAVKNYWIK